MFAILYVYWTTRTRERLALIDKGVDANVFKTDCNKYALVKWGVFLILQRLAFFCPPAFTGL
ncbi:MAG: hypothetical protein IPF54_11715 [Draconibacterium sp.]|nr:hypothetical protein [Draconibacterium sp.]